MRIYFCVWASGLYKAFVFNVNVAHLVCALASSSTLRSLWLQRPLVA